MKQLPKMLIELKREEIENAKEDEDE
jgi:hypothetical protein